MKGSKLLTQGLKFAVGVTEDVGKDIIKSGNVEDVDFFDAAFSNSGLVKNKLLSKSITSSFDYTLGSGFKSTITDKSMTPDSAEVDKNIMTLINSQLLKPLKK